MLDEEGNPACDDLVSSGQGSLDEAEDCCSTSAAGSTDAGTGHGDARSARESAKPGLVRSSGVLREVVFESSTTAPSEVRGHR